MNENYEDIIHLPHPVSKRHPQMSMMNRAAQFAPFAALTGYGEVITESARLTDEQIILEEYDQKRLNRTLANLLEESPHPYIAVRYFKPDRRKQGGSYEQYVGTLKRIDDYEQLLLFTTGKRIPLSAVVDIRSAKSE